MKNNTPKLTLVPQADGMDERQRRCMHRHAMSLVAYATQALRLPSLFEEEDSEEITSIRPRRRSSYMPSVAVQRKVNQALRDLQDLRELRAFKWSRGA